MYLATAFCVFVNFSLFVSTYNQKYNHINIKSIHKMLYFWWYNKPTLSMVHSGTIGKVAQNQARTVMTKVTAFLLIPSR